MRDLFPTRIALRLSEADHVALVLGQGARDRGARCDQIPESLPGVGYVGIDGVAEPVRVRFAHLTDDDIAAMVADYAPGTRPAVEPGGHRTGRAPHEHPDQPRHGRGPGGRRWRPRVLSLTAPRRGRRLDPADRAGLRSMRGTPLAGRRRVRVRGPRGVVRRRRHSMPTPQVVRGLRRLPGEPVLPGGGAAVGRGRHLGRHQPRTATTAGTGCFATVSRRPRSSSCCSPPPTAGRPDRVPSADSARTAAALPGPTAAGSRRAA